jgi:flagellar L-ring protein precursor FlgH
MPAAKHHRGRIAGLFATAVLAAAAPAQNLFRAGQERASLIADHRATATGDILTIEIDENHKVSNNDKTERKTDTTLAARLEAYTLSSDTFKANVLPKFDARSNREFKGESKQQRDSDVRARIAVVVIDVHPNGNLVVAGSRTVQVDDETKTLRISGIVRPLDVSASNMVPSHLVADARVCIKGDGAGTRSVTKGPVGTLFDTLFWAAWPF